MRRIGPAAIITFHLLLILASGLGVMSAVWTIGKLPLGDFRALALVAATAVFVYAYAVISYRAFLRVVPLKEGDIPPGSRQEFAYHVHLFFDLILFGPVLASRALPIPVVRLLYLALGARLGRNTFTAGIICDPIFVTVGDDSILGQDSLIVPHAIEGERLAHYPIRMGHHVTVGAHAVVLNGVTIGDGAIVATGAVVTKGTQIGAGEVWGGVPARFIQRRDAAASG